MLTNAELAALQSAKTRLTSSAGYASQDAYYIDVDLVRELEAKIKGKTARQADPAGFWHGMPSA